MKKIGKFGKRFLAGLCTLALLVTSLGPAIQVAAGSGSGDSREQMERDMEAAIKESLKNEDPAIKKEHPKGIFSFATLKGEVNEENKDPLAVYLVRHGGTKGEQKVKIKFSDYSAEYGKDYYAKLEDSMFAKKVEANPDSVPLFYMFGDDPEVDGEQTAIDEESVIKAYGEERGKKIIELTREYSESEAKAQAKAEAASGSGASAKKKDSEKSGDKKTDKKDDGKEKDVSPLDQLINGTSQYTDSGYALTMDEILSDDERNENTAAYGANMLDTIFPGAETELSFADGEVMKKIYIYPIDNEVSDGDRVFNIQINGGSDDLAWQPGENSSAVTILDNEEDETSLISIGDYTESVGTDGKASVTLKREDGLYKVSTVKFVVKAAEKKVAKGTAIFMPGMKEKKVEFSVSDVDRKTVDNISFVLKKPVGAKVSGDKKKIIDLTDLKTSKKLKGTTSGKDVDEDESPVGMSGTQSYDGILLDLNNFEEDEKTGCNDLTFDITDSQMKLYIADHGCSCKNARVAAKLKKKINQEAVESVSIEFDREDQELSSCNRMYVAKVCKSSGANYGDWDHSQDNVMAAKGDQSKGTMTANFTDGSVSNVNELMDYKNEYLKYWEGHDSLYTDFSITSKKTSGGVNGMQINVYSVKLNFRKYTISIQAPEELEGHAGDLPGSLLLAKTETPGENSTEEVSTGTRYAYDKVNFKNYPDDYAYLDHLEFADGTDIDQKYYEIGGTSATLDMNDDFFNQYQKQIDSTNSKINIRPVYKKKSVKLTINADKHGGIEVNGKQYPRGTKDTEITVHVGDKLQVKPYDVEDDYYFSSYEMIATGLNGKGDSKKIIYSAEEPDNMDIGNYDYTIKPTYTYDGTSVIIKTGNIPAGCGIDKTEWTYKNDRIHAGQILDIRAKTANDYRAKWTITSNTHEWSGKTFYGDMLYHKIGGPTDEIELEFEKCSDIEYVSITGKALVQDATIKNKPFLNSEGVYLGDYKPAVNASVQMGEFTGLTKEDGSYTIYSHTESEDTAQEQQSTGHKETAQEKKSTEQKSTEQKGTEQKSTGKKSAEKKSAVQEKKSTGQGDAAAPLLGNPLTDLSVTPGERLERNAAMVSAKKKAEAPYVDHNKAQGLTREDFARVNKILSGGDYYLKEDISLYGSSSNIIGVEDEVTIDLNGHDLNFTSLQQAEEGYSYPTIFLLNGATLNICDCKGTGQIIREGSEYPAIDSKGGTSNNTLNIYSGTIYNYSLGAAVRCENVNVYGGSLRSDLFTAVCGVSGKPTSVNIAGGNVTGATTGVFLPQGELTISGGEIEGGVSGVSLMDAPMSISGGKLTSKGNGICSGSTVNITGGEVTGDRNGIRLLNTGQELNLMGGKVTGDCAVKSDEKTPIRLFGSYTDLAGKSVDIDTTGKIYIEEKLSKGEEPYLLRPYEGKVGEPLTDGWGTHMGDARISDYFASADSAFTIDSSGNELVVKRTGEVAPVPTPAPPAPGVSHDPGDHSQAVAIEDKSSEQNLGETGKQTSYYLTEDINDRLVIKGDVTLCLNGHKLSWESNDEPAITVSEGTLNICDCQGTGEVYSKSSSAISQEIGLTDSCINIYGGKIHSAVSLNPAIEAERVNVYGGSVRGSCQGIATNILMKECKYNIYGGTVEGGEDGAIYVDKRDTVVNVMGGTVMGGYNGIYVLDNTKNVTIKVTGGEVVGEIEGISYHNIKEQPGASIRLSGGPFVISGGDSGGDGIYTNVKICIDGKLEKASEPVRLNSTYNPLTSGWGAQMGDAYVPDYFVAAGSYYSVIRSDGELVMKPSKEVDPDSVEEFGIPSASNQEGLFDLDPSHYPGDHGEAAPVTQNHFITLGETGEQTSYYLTEDITAISIKTLGDVTLCLNGHKISSLEGTDGLPTIEVQEGTFNVCDCRGTGEIENPKGDYAVFGDDSAVINIYDGVVSNVACTNFNMYGGKVPGAVNTNKNAVVSVHGGEIGEDGDSYCLSLGGNGVLDISGGEVHGFDTSEGATVNMTGGEISSMSTAFLDGVKLNLLGGTVKGKVQSRYSTDEIHLSGRYVEIAGGIDLYGKIYIDEKLTKGSPYQITVDSKRPDQPLTSGWGAMMDNAYVPDYFVSGDSAYSVARSDDELAWKPAGEVNPGSGDDFGINPGGTNVTTYLKAGPNETRTVKVINNGLEQVHYMQITGNLSGVHSSQSDPYMVTDVPALELDFFGDGPTPYSINTLLGTVDGDDFPTRLETSEMIEMRNYSVGFELKVDDVLDDQGEDRIDKVNFYIYNKDNVMKTMHTVKREEHGQTSYTLDRYPIQDDQGNVGDMKMNGLIDFADGDRIYVELVGTMKDENGNKVEDADLSYGMYDSGIRFQEKLDVIEVQLKDVEPSTEDADGGVPTVDVLGQMIPTVKFGRLGVTATVTSNTMEFSVGFDVEKLNKSIYDSETAAQAKQAESIKSEIDGDQAEEDSLKAQRDAKQKEIDALEQEELELYGKISNDGNYTDEDVQRLSEIQDDELPRLNNQLDGLNNSIDELDDVITANQALYDKLTESPEEQKDPLEPASSVEDAKKGVDATSEFSGDDITHSLEKGGEDLDPLHANKVWREMKDKLKKEAEKAGMTKPKSNSLQSHGTISANLSIDIGVSLRFKTQVMTSGNAEWCFDKCLLYGRVQGGVTAMYYFMIPDFPIPLYAGASFSASVGIYAGVGSSHYVTIDQMSNKKYDGSQLYLSGDIPVTLGIEGFVGMGLKSLLAIELGLGFLQKFDFAYTTNGGQVGTGMSSFYGYLQCNVLFFSFKWKFAQANWNYELYNDSKDTAANVQKLMQDNGLGSDAALEDFTVAQTPKVHYYGGAKAENVSKKLRSSYEKNDSTVLAEGLSQTVSDVVPLGDGKYLMAFEGVRTAADCPDDMQPGSADYDYNSRAIYLSYYDGVQWSKPSILQKDDTLDTGLQVEEMGDDILISWSSADHRFTKEEITTGEMTEDGEAIQADAAVKVISAMDVYATVLKKSQVGDFVTASAEDKAKEIDRLTRDQELTDAQRQAVEAGLEEGAEYMGYGHQNGQAVSVGDQIYLFYDTVDYNYWKDGEKPENLSDIADAKGYIFYKIYDRKTGEWLEEYADSAEKETYEKLGFTQGQRMADVHLSVTDSDERILPMAAQMDAQAVKVKGEDRVALTYIVDSDGINRVDSFTGEPLGDQALFIAFMTPAEITDGAVKTEAKWSEPLQMNTELSSINDPQMVQTKQNGEDTVYLVWADDDCLMYSNLTKFFKKVEMEKDEAEGESYTPVEVSTRELQNGKKVEVYTMKDGIEPKIGILGDEENGFQYNNGYRLAADDKGHLYAVWAQSSGGAQGLYLSAMSMTGGESGTEVWSKPRALDWDEESGGQYLTDPSIAVDGEGNIILGHNAYNLENVTTTNEKGTELLDSRKHADDTFCVTVEKAIGSPVLEDAALSNDYPRAGEEFTVTASAGNDGFLAAEELSVKAEFVQKKGDTETVLDTQTQSYTNVGSGHREEVHLPFTMKQEYLDAAKNDKATYQIRLTAVEKKAGTEENYKETASATVDVKTGAHYVFTNENVDGYRCRDYERDTQGGTIRFGKDTGENRYMYSATVVNDGNLPAEDMKVSMFASNEYAFMNDQNDYGTFEGTAEEWTEYNKKHAASDSVVCNEDFDNWTSLKSFMADEVKSLGVGESAELDVLTVKIPDSMYSRLGGLDLMLAVYDNAAKDNDATKNEGLSTLPVSIVEEENVDLSIWCGGKKAEDQILESGDTVDFNALVMPLKAAPDYSVLWESSDPKVATVSNGDVTTVGPGKATIKASLMKDGEETASQSVDVIVTGDGTPALSPTPAPAASQKPSAASQKPSATQAPQATQNNAKKQVKVTFKGNKGKVKKTSSKTVTVGEKYGTLPKATRKGYAFKGWYTKKSGGTKVTKNTKVTNQSAHSLYAHWKKVKVGKAQIKKLTAKKGKKLKVTVKPVKSADGYQICYSPKKKFKKKTTKKKSTKKKTVTLKKLKKGKKRYVKVRAYKLDSAGKKVYGKYGKVKKKKIKS